MLSNLTNEEFFRINGFLDAERAEPLLDAADKLEAVQECVPCIQEAINQYPAEDFLHNIVSRLHALQKNLRGANREELGDIIESLDDALQCQFNATEYGISELRQIVNALK